MTILLWMSEWCRWIELLVPKWRSTGSTSVMNKCYPVFINYIQQISVISKPDFVKLSSFNFSILNISNSTVVPIFKPQANTFNHLCICDNLILIDELWNQNTFDIYSPKYVCCYYKYVISKTNTISQIPNDI